MGKGNERPTRVQVLESCTLLALVVLLAYLVLHRPLFLYLAVAMLGLPLVAGPLATAVVGWWLKLSELLAAINSTIILCLVFFGVLTPLAFVYRLFNRDPLRLRWDSSASYYVERNHTFSSSDLEKLW
jgi:hypothetical protein